MHWLRILFCCSICTQPLPQATAAVQITELAAAGRQGLRDEDGDTPDWVELQNVSSEPIDLQGWTLSEESGRLKTWALPSTNLPSGECLVVFASGKDRRTPGQPLHANFKLPRREGTLVLRGPAEAVSRIDHYPPQVAGISFGLPGSDKAADSSAVIRPDTPGRFLVPRNDALGMTWVAPECNDAQWRRTRGSIGYDTEAGGYSDLIRTDLERELFGRLTSVYLRIPFVLTNAAPVQTLDLHAHYDDGLVIWVNGREAARRNAPAGSAWNSAALAARPDTEAAVPERIDLSSARQFLVQGTNWLAVQVLNSAPESSDLLFRAHLRAEHFEPIPREPVPSTHFYLLEPTPGRRNADAVHRGPRIEWVSRQPAVLTAGGPLAVTARISPVEQPAVQVDLCFRVMFENETTVRMQDDGQHQDGAAGDNIYGATLPADRLMPGQMIRYCVLVRDAAGQSSRWPLFPDRPDYSAYEGTVLPDPSLQTRLPVLHLFTGRDAPNRPARSRPLALFYEGELYDNIVLTPHGQISRSFPKQSLNVRFPRDREFVWRGDAPAVQRVDLLSNFADKSKIRNTLAYEMIAASGSIGHFAFPVRVQRNGAFHSVAELVENGDSQWLRRAGLNPQGALYKMNNNLTSVHGAEKKTRKDLDTGNLAQFIRALSEDRPLEARAAYAYEHVDLPQCISYLVAMALISSDDHGHKNYYLYQDVRGTGEWALLPWDVDLSWGRNWTGQYFNETVFVDNPLDLYRNGRSKPRNRLYNLLFQHAEFRQMYLRRLRTVMDELLRPPGTAADALPIETRLRELLDQIDPPEFERSDADLDEAAWPSWGRPASARAEGQAIAEKYLRGRRQFLFQSGRARLLGDAIPSAQPADVSVQFAALALQPGLVVLTNANEFAVDISGWQLSGAGVQHHFRPGTVIPAGRSLCAVENVVEFRRAPPPVAGQRPCFVQGNWKGALQAGRGPLRLMDARGRQVSRAEVAP